MDRFRQPFGASVQAFCKGESGQHGNNDNDPGGFAYNFDRSFSKMAGNSGRGSGSKRSWRKRRLASATCDGFFFRGKPIIVVGGGDTAMEEALFLTKFASEVKLVHRKHEFRASKIMADRVLANEKIEVIWNTEVREINGTMETGVESVKLFNNQTNEEYILPTQGVFIAIGHQPNTSLFKGQLDMDEVGYLITEGKTMKTNIEGVFACGDAQDAYYRQAITAAGTGCMAAIDAERFLAEHGS